MMILLLNQFRCRVGSRFLNIVRQNYHKKSVKSVTAKVLQHFDDYYRAVYGKAWPSIRLALLCKPKTSVLLNSFSVAEDTENVLLSLGAENIENMLEQTETRKSKETVSNPQPYSFESNDDSDFANESRFSLDSFVPISKMKFQEEIISETDYFSFYSHSSEAVEIFKDMDLSFPKQWTVMTFPRGNITNFPDPVKDSIDLYPYRVLSGSSILPVLAMNIKAGDDVADLCAGSGEKSLAIIQSMIPQSIFINDSSQSNMNKIKKAVEDYVPSFFTKHVAIEFHQLDVCEMPNSRLFNKIILDAPYMDDRVCVNEEENNFFSGAMIQKRNFLPHRLRDMLTSALSMLKEGGSLVYCTSTLSPVLNDGVVQEALHSASKDTNATFVVSDVKDYFKRFSPCFKLDFSFRYGVLVLPSLLNNYGPTYFSKITCTAKLRKPLHLDSPGFSLKKLRVQRAMVSTQRASKRTKVEESFHLSWMNQMQPKFGISASSVSILQEPKQFFEELKILSRTATCRITIASLYIGITDLEKELVDSIQESLEVEGSQVEVQVLLDATRGSRGKINSRSLLLPLIRQHPDRMKVSLYHSPHLRGWIRWLLPERWNETVGLTHLKVYLFDDTLVLSGANLNEQYFENRQDRYMVFRNCPDLAEFFANLVSTVSEFSLQLNASDKLQLHPSWKEHPFLGNQEYFLKEAKARVQALLCQPPKKASTVTSNAVIDTWVVPLLQMRPLGVHEDEKATQALLEGAPKDSLVKMATGYFNMTHRYIDSILNSCKANFNLLVASPKVNGFFGASGLAGAIPAAYVCIEKDFFGKVCKLGQRQRVSLHEYERGNWTFHAKGIWYYPPGEQWPVLTFIGSPNFGYRSVYRDLEAQVALVTTNQKLQQELHQEQEHLYKYKSLVSEKTFSLADHQVALWVRLVTKLIKTFF